MRALSMDLGTLCKHDQKPDIERTGRHGHTNSFRHLAKGIPIVNQAIWGGRKANACLAMVIGEIRNRQAKGITIYEDLADMLTGKIRASDG
jgi:hypothetical protein